MNFQKNICIQVLKRNESRQDKAQIENPRSSGEKEKDQTVDRLTPQGQTISKFFEKNKKDKGSEHQNYINTQSNSKP